jgi:hypothetical protein
MVAQSRIFVIFDRILRLVKFFVKYSGFSRNVQMAEK